MAGSLQPSRVRGRPYAAAVFVGCLAGMFILASYAFLFEWVAGTDRELPGVIVYDLVVAGICGLSAVAVARGLIVSGRALELTASLALCALYWSPLVEILADPVRVERLTVHCCQVLLVAGVVIRSKRALTALAVGAVISWAVVAGHVHVSGFDATQWWPTWLITVGVTFAARWMAGTERRLEQRSRRDAETVSWRDPLTGLLNRRGFTRQADPVLALAQRGGQALWCSFIDIDHFKSVNDTQGHEVGDEVLVATAAALQHAARASDIPARWGGDEFVLLGVGPPPAEHDLEQRIGLSLSRLPARITDLWTPSVTVGTASRIADATSDRGRAEALAALMTAADENMYASRRVSRANLADPSRS